MISISEAGTAQPVAEGGPGEIVSVSLLTFIESVKLHKEFDCFRFSQMHLDNVKCSVPTLACGEVIHRPHGHVMLESYPINAKCEWTLQVGQGATIELR